MKKTLKLFILGLLCFGIFLLEIKAETVKYFEVTRDQKYRLCTQDTADADADPSCEIVEPEQAKLKSNGKTLEVNGVEYIKLSELKTDWGEISDISLDKVCASPGFRKPLKFIGTFVVFLKIVVPGLIVIFGIVDLAKTVMAEKNDKVFAGVKSVGVRIIGGIFIFFLPGLIQMVLNWVNEFSDYSNTWCCCTQCILDANNCDVNSCSSSSCKIGGMNS